MLETFVTYKVVVGDFASLSRLRIHSGKRLGQWGRQDSGLLYDNKEIRARINACIQSVESCWLSTSSLPPANVLCFTRRLVLAVTTEFVQKCGGVWTVEARAAWRFRFR